MKRIKSESLVLGKEKEFKFIEANEIKAHPIYEYLREKLVSFGNLRNDNGVEFVLFPDGARGIRLTFTDDTKKLYRISNKGKFAEVIPYRDYVVSNTFMDKLSRLFGLTKEMQYTESNKIDLIHGLMFLTGCALITGLIFLIFNLWNYLAL